METSHDYKEPMCHWQTCYVQWVRIPPIWSKVLNSHLFLLAIFQALTYCLITQASMYLGMSKAHTNSGRWCLENDSSRFHTHLWKQFLVVFFFGHRMFGWTATHVHEKIVIRQLQVIVEMEYREMLFWLETEHSDKESYRIIVQSRPVQMISY